ncbi:ATP-binding cassette domain-containing protein [Clostridium sediminicola]|uniref:ABC transporter ATP-binding protein n=1 Tax=Clostridium sediminicola TaxID=3114879 RepID=UPI0031F20C7D
MIVVNNLCKKYGKTRVVKKISFSIKAGEVVAIIGKRGAGKTTIFRILSTIIKPTSGTGYINRKSIIKNRKDIRKDIGIIFGGEFALYEKLTAEENIRYFAKLHKIDKAKINSRVNELLNKFELEEVRNVKVENYSAIMKQKVVLARSIVHDPKLLLLDEPSKGLDTDTTRLIDDFILENKNKGKTIVISSGILDSLEKVCDRVIILHKGKIADEGGFDYLKKKYNGEKIELALEKIVGDEYV